MLKQGVHDLSSTCFFFSPLSPTYQSYPIFHCGLTALDVSAFLNAVYSSRINRALVYMVSYVHICLLYF